MLTWGKIGQEVNTLGNRQGYVDVIAQVLKTGS
jgi:hypothetical protein